MTFKSEPSRLIKDWARKIKREVPNLPQEKILVACSGGLDSTLMLYLLTQVLKLKVGIAHVNHALRGEDSMLDEAFVAMLADEINSPFFVSSLNPTNLSKATGQSIQMAARQLRHDYLSSIASINGYTLIATAHHADDELETLILNFMKGSVLKGISGSPVLVGKKLKPLSYLTKDDIRTLGEYLDLKWREDISNQSDKYLRNRIRHHIIQVVKNESPNIIKTLSVANKRRREVFEVYSNHIEHLRKETVHALHDGRFIIELQDIKDKVSNPSVLFDLLSPFGAHYKHAQEIWKCIKEGTSRLWQLDGTTLYLNARELTIIPLQDEFMPKQESNWDISDAKELNFKLGGTIVVGEVIPISRNVFSRDTNMAWFDYQTLQGTLTWRPWEHGDRIKGFGLNGSALVSDLLTNAKVPMHQKMYANVLCKDDDIIWVPGLRQSRLYKVDENTTQVLQLTARPK